MGWKELLQLAAAAVSLVGLLVSGVMKLTGLKKVEDVNPLDLPAISLSAIRQSEDRPHMVTFTLVDVSGWVVDSVAIRGRWAPKHLAPAGEIVQLGYLWGREIGGPWQRRIDYPRPESSGVVLVHRDAPDCELSFKIHLRSQPKVKGELTERYERPGSLPTNLE